VDKPIGTLLVLWPALTALFIASNGHPSAKVFFIFLLGTFVIRSGGCIINDIADRKFDKHVARTKARPLATGEIKLIEAYILAGILFSIGFILVLFLNIFTIYLAIIAALLTVLYPLMKRITHFPQVWLGFPFNAGILIAFTAVQNKIPFSAILLYFSAVLLTIAFDTFYAMVDYEDDIKIGVKSTAIIFGQHAKKIILSLSFIAIFLLILVGVMTAQNSWYFFGLIFASLLIIIHYFFTKNREDYFKAFLNYNYVWLFIFLGTFLSYL